MSEKQKPGIGAYFSLFMSTLFIFGAVGIAMGWTDHIDFIRENRLLVAIPVLLYGLLRLYLSVRALRGNDGTFND